MTDFHLAFRAVPGPGAAVLQPRLSPAAPGVVGERTSVSVHLGRSELAYIAVVVDPQRLSLAATVQPGALGYWRLADGTIRPMAETPDPLTFQKGDAYVAVTPAAARLAAAEPGGASAAIARFLHLRDYFNADKLAAALLAHLQEAGAGLPAEGAAVLVVEAR